MRWLVTGSGGRLGTALIARLTADDAGLTGAEDDVILPLDRASLDVTDSAAVYEAVSDFRPDVVVNTAAHSAGEPGSALAADDAPVLEDDHGHDQHDHDQHDHHHHDHHDDDHHDDDHHDDDQHDDEQRAYSVNAVGPAVLALAVAAIGRRLVHVSSDLVFAGDATGPYPVDGPTAPRSAYGRSQRAGELAVCELLPADGYVVRTSWLYGGAGDEVVARAVRLAAATDEAEVGESDARDDRPGAPTWVSDLAEGLIALSRSDAPSGIYHCTNSGQTTRLGFARAVLDELGAEPERLIPRPPPGPPWPAAHSLLSGQEWAAAGLRPLPDWRDALHRAFVIDGDRLRTR